MKEFADITRRIQFDIEKGFVNAETGIRYMAVIDAMTEIINGCVAASEGKMPAEKIEFARSAKAESMASMASAWLVAGYEKAIETASKMMKRNF